MVPSHPAHAGRDLFFYQIIRFFTTSKRKKGLRFNWVSCGPWTANYPQLQIGGLSYRHDCGQLYCFNWFGWLLQDPFLQQG